MKRVPFFDNPVLQVSLPAWRAKVVLILLSLGALALLVRAMFLQGLSTEFLQQQGEQRYERTLVLPATRGKILDRNGVVLASSVPARAVWAIPEDARQAEPQQIQALADLLGMPAAVIRSRLDEHADRSFLYIRRQLPMDLADRIRDLKIPGIHLQPETRRQYPEGETMAHVVGFTSIEDQGQEAIELAFNEQLSGSPGSRRVIRDRLGRVIEDVRAVDPPVDGRDLRLSLDSRVQFQAYRALADAMEEHKAAAASAVVLDAMTGEILALVNLPTFDPNRRETFQGAQLRNRVLTDTFEPGSTMKPFTAALALDLGRIGLNTQFDTGHGQFRYQGNVISDVSRNNGVLDVAGILRRSSNIGMTLISERLESREMWDRFTELGLGQAPSTGFPGAAAGRLRPWERWRLIEKATMSYGYGLSASLLQLARAYSVFARDGDMVSLSMVQRQSAPTSVQVFKPETARAVRAMLEAAAGPDGAVRAQVQGYRVAGKSGTARKIVDGQYSMSRYRSSFVGFAPVSNPRIIVAVSIDEPNAGAYFGGRVAAPVFSSIVSGSLRILGVQPDAPFESIVAADKKEGA